MRHILALVVLLLSFPSVSLAMAFANGSSTIGTLMVEGLEVGTPDLEVECSHDEVFVYDAFSAEPGEILSDEDKEFEMISYFQLINPEAAERLKENLEPAMVGSLDGFYGTVKGKDQWLVPTAEGEWVLITENTDNVELMYDLLFSLRHPKVK